MQPQPYSELANWDGALSARVATSASASSSSPPEHHTPSDPDSANLFGDVSVMVDSLSPPSPPDSTLINKGSSPHSHPDRDHSHAHSPSIYDIYHKFTPQSNSQQVNRQNPHTSTSDSSSVLGASNSLFPSNGHESVLSPQEREIMEDITLDPDDPAAWPSAANDASLSKKDAKSRSLQSRSASVTAASRRPAPAPLTVASASASISPSPFAPPAPITVPPFKSPSPSHLIDNAPEAAPAQPDNFIISACVDERAAIEYVIDRTSASRDQGKGEQEDSPSREDGQSVTGDLDAEMLVVDPSPARAPSQQSPAPPLDTSNRSSSSRSRVSPRHLSKTPLFLPSPSESLPSDHPLGRDGEHDPSDVIYISSASSASSSPSSPPPSRLRRRTRNKDEKKKNQLMAYVLVPPLPPGMRKADYQPLGQLLPTRERRSGAKGKARVGDNSGTRELASALQGAFENNSLGAGNAQISRKRRGKGKRKAVDPVEVVDVVDDEDGREGVEVQSMGSKNLALALAEAFAHNSADPKVSAMALAGSMASGSARRVRRSAPIMTLSDSASVEVVLPPPTKRTRAPANVQVISDADVNDPPASTRVSPRRKGKGQPRMSTSPQKKRQRTTLRGGDSDRDEKEEDDEIEIIVDGPRQLRRVTRGRPHDENHLPPPKPKSLRDTQRHRTSTPSPKPISISTSSTFSPPPSLPAQSAPATPPDVNTLAGFPLTILPAPTPAEIVIPSRALSHLHASPGPPDPGAGAKAGEGDGTSDSQMQTTTQHGSLQGFHHEEAAEGAHGLLTSPTAAVTTAGTPVTTGSSPRAPTTDPQNAILNLGDIVVPMDIDDGAQEQARERQDADQAADIALGVSPHSPRISSPDHLDDPMLGFVLSEHEGAERAGAAANAGASYLGIGIQPRANMGADLEFTLASLNASPGANPVWIDWGTGVVFGAATASVSTGGIATGQFTGDGTIDPSVLGGGAGASSPGKLFRSDSDHSTVVGDCLSSPERFPLSRATDEDENMDDLGDEEDVMGLLFQNPADGEFVSPSSVTGEGGKGKGKGKGKNKVVTGIEHEHAGTRSIRRRRKSWRKALADDNDATAADDHDDNDDRGREIEETPSVSSSLPSLQASEWSFCHHCRRNTCRPKMRCTQIRASTGEQCRKLFCNLCIEKRYPDLTFDKSATVFICPFCANFCNCSHCARARGEEYISERNGGWRKWKAWPAPPAAATGLSTSPPSTQKRRRARQNLTGVVKATGKSKGTSASLASVASEAFQVPSVSESENWSTAVFTVTGEPLGEAFLEGNTAHILPILPATPPSTLTSTFRPAPAPTPATATALPPGTADASSSIPVSKRQQHRHVFIGKPLKAWGRCVTVPDPEDQLQKTKTRFGVGRGRGKHKRVSTRMFIGSERPLLSRRVKRKRHRSASLIPSAQESGEDADHVDQDADEGVWPEEYVVALPTGAADDAVDATPILRITPEEVERAIGAAFAVGAQ